MKITYFLMLGLLATSISACNTMGPRTISGAHINYNDAVSKTRDEELLRNLVRLHYRDTPMFLKLTEINAQYSIGYEAGATGSATDARGKGAIGVLGGLASGATTSAGRFFTGGGNRTGTATRNRSYTDTDVLSGNVGISYGEQPTITYKPQDGQEYATQLLTPIPGRYIAALVDGGWGLSHVLKLTLSELDGKSNAPHASGPRPTSEPDTADFDELVSKWDRLHKANLLRFEWKPAIPDKTVRVETTTTSASGKRTVIQDKVIEKGREEGIYVEISNPNVKSVQAKLSSERVKSLLREDPNVLDDVFESFDEVFQQLTDEEKERDAIPFLLQESPSLQAVDDTKLVSSEVKADLKQRSLLGVLNYLSNAVETPDKHLDDNLVVTTKKANGEDYEWTEALKDYLHIESSNSLVAQRGAFVQERYRGYYFYIPDDCLESKATFAMLSHLVALQASEVKADGTPKVLGL